MEREREIAKLVSVLRRIARAAGYAALSNAEPDAARFCVNQYNKVLARLTEIEPGIARLFTALGEGASPEVIRMAARELAAYFEEELYGRGRRAPGCGARVWVGCSPLYWHW